MEEKKGHVLSNRQDVRHECQTKGVQSKCHICEDIRCGDLNSNSSLTSGETCSFQLQGVSTDEMSRNIPTVSDVPWAVGGSYRYDYGGVNTSHVCLHMSGGACQSNFGQDYSHCQLRCWGHFSADKDGDADNIHDAGNATIVSGTTSGEWFDDHSFVHRESTTPWTLSQPTQTWSYPKRREKQVIGNPRNQSRSGLEALPQGFTFTLAGAKNGEAGFVDGWEHEAR